MSHPTCSTCYYTGYHPRECVETLGRRGELGLVRPVRDIPDSATKRAEPAGVLEGPFTMGHTRAARHGQLGWHLISDGIQPGGPGRYALVRVGGAALGS